ncbi:MAG: tetratricopeptide repeat protein [Treponema sp.]|jgi:tetratricopeptide (TPR) repeat protein|nr:tetratricopeptide repeat protein [Treponema sp.]
MKLDTVLAKASRLARRRDFEGALRTLKTEEDRYNGSFKYYYLFGLISLYAGSFGEALSNFRLARQIKMKDPLVLLGLAVLYLKRMNTVQAVDYYLDVQEMDPKNKIAKKALVFIRKYSSSEDLSDFLTPKKLKKLYPPIPSPDLNSRTILTAAIVISAVLILSYGILAKFNLMPGSKKNDSRSVTEFILSGQERSNSVESGGSYMYILTVNQAADLYDRALSLFTSYRDEAAKINLNRILESNASQSIKDKSRLLLTYMETPGFNSFNRNDNPSYAAVISEPAIYRDVHVIWRGMATNIEITDEYTRFDFLVGYDTRRSLEGIIPVFFYKPVAINNERPLEVLGKIKIVSSYSDISLEGVAIHQSARLEN